MRRPFSQQHGPHILLGALAFLTGCSLLAIAGLPESEARAEASFQFGLNVGDTANLPLLESAIGVKPKIVGIYRDWVHAPDFPTAETAAIRARGATPLISWEPWDSHLGAETDPAFTCAKIAAGSYDALVTRWARQAKSFGSTVWIRFAPEQNGTWLPWSIGKPGNSGAECTKMWRHVVTAYRQVGATNVKWVWNPFVDVGGSTAFAAGYPGGDYVDLIGLDGFNWGNTRSWGWQSYDDIFSTSVAILKQMAPEKQWFIAESASAGGTLRPAWIKDTVQAARRDGAIALVWFEFNKETDWRLSNDKKACAALRTALAS